MPATLKHTIAGLGIVLPIQGFWWQIVRSSTVDPGWSQAAAKVEAFIPITYDDKSRI